MDRMLVTPFFSQVFDVLLQIQESLLLLEQVIALGYGVHKVRLEPPVNEIFELLHLVLPETRLRHGHGHVPDGFL